MVALVVRLAEIWLKSHQIEKGMKNNPWDEKEPIEKEKKRKIWRETSPRERRGENPPRAAVIKPASVLLGTCRPQLCSGSP